MGFVSLEFAVLFVFIIATLSAKKNKKLIIFIANIVFYLYTGINNILFFLGYVVLMWMFGSVIFRGGKRLLSIFLLVAISPLLMIKLANNIVLNLSWFMIPLGVSFWSFQAIAFLVDVSKGKINSYPKFTDFFLYMTFFPSVSSGPINRVNVLQQFEHISEVEFEQKRVEDGLRYVLCGVFLKFFVAERMSILVNGVYKDIENASGLGIFIASLFFFVQIYCDFAGYSNIAYGLARVMGINIQKNFNSPYRAESLTDFWRRWHISLSSWLRDYIYIPLGGSKCADARKNLNLIATFSLSGIWHGIGLNYFLWGVIHGIALCIEKWIDLHLGISNKFMRCMRKCGLMIFLYTTWIIFRVEKFSDFVLSIKKMLFETVGNITEINSVSKVVEFVYSLNMTVPDFLVSIFALLMFVIFEVFIDIQPDLAQRLNRIPRTMRWVVYFIMTLSILIFGQLGNPGDFIYSNF